MRHSISTAIDPVFSGAVTTTGARVWAGRILSALAILFLAFDTASKLLQLAPAVQGTIDLGYQPGALPVIGLVELGCLVAYVVPRTSPIGAVLLTGYFGGAVATHLRLGNPLLSHTLFPIYVAALVWGGLYLRDRRVRALLPV
jgi:hypothetical protein